MENGYKILWSGKVAWKNKEGKTGESMKALLGTVKEGRVVNVSFVSLACESPVETDCIGDFPVYDRWGRLIGFSFKDTGDIISLASLGKKTTEFV